MTEPGIRDVSSGMSRIGRPSLVVVTGFREFPGVPRNPSALLVEHLEHDRHWAREASVAVRCKLLDTVYAGTRAQIAGLLQDAPAALILSGYSGLAKGLKIETRATNLCSPDHADAIGWIPAPRHDPVLERANTGVDFSRLVGALREAGVSAALSRDAGEYVCNHAYWHALDLIAQGELQTRAIFVHLPTVEGMSDSPRGMGAMPLETMKRGLALIAREMTMGIRNPTRGEPRLRP